MRRQHLLLATLAVALGWAGSAGAQTIEGSTAQTALQRSIARSMDAVCATGAANPETAALQNECAGLQALAGANDPALNPLLQQLSTEELAAQEALLRDGQEGQFANIASRLAALRGGASAAGVVQLTPTRVEDALAEQLHDRGGAAGAGDAAAGLFVNGQYARGDHDSSSREDGFDFDAWNITAGIDRRLDENLVVGVALGYGEHEVDFDVTSLVIGGEIEGDSVASSLYGTWYSGDLYVDVIGTYTWIDYDTERLSNTAGGVARFRASPEANSYGGTVQIGYDMSQDALSFSPYLRLDYLDVEIDDFTERGAVGVRLNVDDQDFESFTGALGVRGSMAVSRDWGVLVPTLYGEWEHEFEDDGHTIKARFVGDPTNTTFRAETNDPDENYFVVGGGLSAVLKGGTQLFVEYSILLGHDDIDNQIITGGLRLAF